MGAAHSSLQFKVQKLLKKAKKRIGQSVDGISITLPLISANLKIRQVERQIAREVAVKLKNRRVLKPRKEADEHNIEKEIASIQKIRGLLVEKQVELAQSDLGDGDFYLIIEFMLAPINQFLSFHEKWSRKKGDLEAYRSTYELLRDHVCSCLAQIYRIARMKIPPDLVYSRYDRKWNLDAYDL